MEIRTSGDLSLSVMTLGTCQFGLEYGIANRTGQPSYEDARDIIAAAYEGGVNCLDTAALYGTSEEVVGRALEELGIADRMMIETKIVQMADEGISPKEAAAIVEKSVANSLKCLKLDFLPICLFHKDSNFLNYSDHLLALRDRGLVKHVGASVSSPEGAADVIGTGLAHVLQIPSSVMDQRYLRTGILGKAKEMGITVLVRSIYLQGLLLMKDEDIMPELAEFLPVLGDLRGLAAGAGIGMAEMTARYMMSVEGITSLVVGVDTVEQMRDNISLFNKGPLDSGMCAAIEKSVPDLPERLLFPGNWPKAFKKDPVTKA